MGKAFSTLPMLSLTLSGVLARLALALGGPSSMEPCIIKCSISFQPCLPHNHRMKANEQRWIPHWDYGASAGTSHLAWEQVLIR